MPGTGTLPSALGHEEFAALLLWAGLAIPAVAAPRPLDEVTAAAGPFAVALDLPTFEATPDEIRATGAATLATAGERSMTSPRKTSPP